MIIKTKLDELIAKKPKDHKLLFMRGHLQHILELGFFFSPLEGQNSMKNWKQPPAKQAVEKEILHFFRLLSSGKLEEAKARVLHHSDDWDHQIWSLWTETYLIVLEELDQEVDDESFEGRGWQTDLRWLKALGIDQSFHWDEMGSHVSPEGEHLFVHVTYEGELTDVTADFRVILENGEFTLQRQIIHVA